VPIKLQVFAFCKLVRYNRLVDLFGYPYKSEVLVVCTS